MLLGDTVDKLAFFSDVTEESLILFLRLQLLTLYWYKFPEKYVGRSRRADAVTKLCQCTYIHMIRPFDCSEGC